MKISNQNHVFGFIESLIPRVDYYDIRSVVHCTKSTSRKPWPIQQRNLGGIITIRDSIIIRVNWRSLSNLQCFRSLALNNQQETSEVKPVFSLNLRFKTSKIAKDTTISLIRFAKKCELRRTNIRKFLDHFKSTVFDHTRLMTPQNEIFISMNSKVQIIRDNILLHLMITHRTVRN